MKSYHLVTLTLLLSVVALVVGQGCVPGSTCKPPNCRCWDDPSIPGNVTNSDTPQMVLVSFEYAVNSANIQRYKDIFDGVVNPNRCPLHATFFVQDHNTAFSLVKELFDEGHEIGMTSLDGIVPKNSTDWLHTYRYMKKKIAAVNVTRKAIKGSRGPELNAGGDAQFNAIYKVGLSYDSTCASTQFSFKGYTLWPYTYDFVYNTPKCNIGQTPIATYPGKWQFLVASTRFNGINCATLSACSPFIHSQQDAFDMLFESFSNHYDGTKSPFVLYVDPLWLSVEHQYLGTKQFVQFIRMAYDEDTWFITHQQALAWMKSPVTSQEATNFKPWKCVNE